MSTMTPTYEQLELDFAPAPLCRYEVVVTVNDVAPVDLKTPANTLGEAEDAIRATMQAAQAVGVQVANHTSLSWVGLRHGEIWRATVISIPLHDG